MKTQPLLSAALFCAALFAAKAANAEIPQTEALNRFIGQMVKQHHFNEADLKHLFQSVNIQQAILDAMAKPAEGKPWQQYREIFLTESRIDGGVQFWRDNQAALSAVERNSGVPAEIIVAIIGVETKYGAFTGKYRVMDALSTLGFAYPSRSEFFLKELENFLLLSREEHLDPLQPMGSYAGAMGLTQFMPSSYRAYARDFDHDNKRDIWHNPSDAIASVANYFVANHWQRGGAIAYRVSAKGQGYKSALTKGVKPDMPLGRLRKLGIQVPAKLADKEQVKLLSYPFSDHEELWLGLHNFYVITRYNHSPLYAMAAYQLSRAIREKKAQN
ncbi:lytic murein transglycosylase B [Methylomonas sp. SURF-2]|uniref:Lytic murein transglycosylase B n=1 Tax=Methylomonas subterranea TaxID=2952225 RepID=A0ABT1TBR9_9GAMM|nr:lytic murein transglycosylase B [Methylomonas sp. SURF-2]MCQ8102557.1 lytic murein transglycosylase B [Methylomonas sp. SURF-2]